MKKEDRKKLYKLLEEWTRYEIIARIMPMENQRILFPTGHPFMSKIECEDEIRKLLYGSDDLVKLGLKWKILKPYTKDEKKRLKQKKKESDDASKELLDFFGKPTKKSKRSKRGKSRKN